jgi:hypothetical protein
MANFSPRRGGTVLTDIGLQLSNPALGGAVPVERLVLTKSGQCACILIEHDFFRPSFARRSWFRESGKPAAAFGDHAWARLKSRMCSTKRPNK